MNLVKAYRIERQLIQARLASQSIVERVFKLFMAGDITARVKHYAEDTAPSWSVVNELNPGHDLSSGSINKAYADGGLDPEDEKFLLHLKQHYRERLSDEW